MSEQESSVKFNSFGLSEQIIKVLDEVGYETPSAIQAQCIPHLLNDIMSLKQFKPILGT